jgi:hypothetical protein
MRGRKAIQDIELRRGRWLRNSFVAAAQSGTGIVSRRDTDDALQVRRDEGELWATATKSKQTQRKRRPPKNRRPLER